jgi:hypothetical protein
MEIDAMLRRKIKIKKQLLVVRDIIMVLLGLLFILVAFVYTVDVNNAIGDGLKNIRYGLFAFALIIAGTSLIISVYIGKRKQILKLIQPKSRDKK